MKKSNKHQYLSVVELQNQGLIKDYSDATYRNHKLYDALNDILSSKLFRFMSIIRNELLHGSNKRRALFLPKIARSLSFRLFGMEIFRNLPPLDVGYNDIHSYKINPNENTRYHGYNHKNAYEALFPEGDNIPSYKTALQQWNDFIKVIPQEKERVYLERLKPHQGTTGVIRIGYFTFGGLGDALQASPMIAEIKRKFTPCEITHFHTRNFISNMNNGNGNVKKSIPIDHNQKLPILKKLSQLDIFDIIIEHGYIPHYIPCYNSRVTSSDEQQWLRGNAEIAKSMDQFLNFFPIRNNIFARAVKPLSVLDLMGTSGGLPVSAKSPLYFFPDMADAGITEKLSLLHPYITVHNGVDSVVELQNSTKQLPVDRWEKLIEGVKNLGIHVVQIGTSNETRLPGVDWDLRGETTFSELCFILKDALLHIDTEGGLVHMARAANKKSIVLFGPTSPDFFAYPQNINLVATECSNCWWVTNDWLRECPLGKETTCMDTIDISAIPDIVKNELKLSRARSFQLVTKSLFSKKFVEDEADLVDSIHTAAGLVDEGLGTHAADMTSGPYVHASKKWEYPFAVKCLENHFGSLKGLKVADIGSGRGALVFGLAQKGAEASVFDIDYQWDNQGDPGIEDRFLALGNRFANISFGSIFNIPANSGEYDAVICISVIEHIIHKRVAIQELLRLLKVGGMLVLTFDLVDARQNHQHLFDGIRKEIFEAASLDHHIGALCGEAHLFTPEEIAENARHIHDAGVLGIPEGMTVGGIALIRTQ